MSAASLVGIRVQLRISGDGALKKGGATEDGDREVLMALDGHREARACAKMAEDLYGAERVAAEWDTPSLLPAMNALPAREAAKAASSGIGAVG